MTIETKFNIGDEIWFMNGNKPVNYKVSNIIVKVYKKGMNASNMHKEYDIFYSPESLILNLDESKVFQTKQELITSL